MNTKELSAKEFLKQTKTNSRDFYNRNAVYSLMEDYATARLEAYKEELREWLQAQADFITDDDDVKDRYARTAYQDVLSHLNNDQ